MRIIEFGNESQKKVWNDFILNHGGSFLQSWEWGEVIMADGRKIWRLGMVEENTGRILCAALIIRHDLPFKKCYFYVPYGPVFILSPADPSLWQNFWYRIKEIAAAQNAVFFKIEPQIASAVFKSNHIFEELGFRKSRSNVQPRKTLILDLAKSDEELLEEMHPKTRYNIRLARKKGVVVRGWPGRSAGERFEIFWRLMLQTASRDKIRTFPKSRYRRVFDILGKIDPPAGGCELYTAECVSPEGVNEILASIFVVRWGEAATYLYGASSGRFRNLMAPYLIQWEAILDAKIKGCKYYDFWGVDERKWSGVTRFKKGFGGEEIEYVGSWDHVFKSGWYWIYKIARNLRFGHR